MPDVLANGIRLAYQRSGHGRENVRRCSRRTLHPTYFEYRYIHWRIAPQYGCRSLTAIGHMHRHSAFAPQCMIIDSDQVVAEDHATRDAVCGRFDRHNKRAGFVYQSRHRCRVRLQVELRRLFNETIELFDKATNPLVSRSPAAPGGFGRKANNQGFGRI